MTRVKGGIHTRLKHKKVLKQAKGYRMSRSKLFTSAQDAVLHAGEYAYVGRKQKKRNFRRLWIVRLNAALRERGTTYSLFIKNLKENNIDIDRKILSYLSVKEPDIFTQIVEHVTK